MSRRLLRARLVVPLSGPPLANGAVLLEEGTVRAVGDYGELTRHARGGTETDLGDSVLMPGLVNAHCHLDYTRMAGQIITSHSFTDWITCMTQLKASFDRDEYFHSWSEGAQMLLRSGTTTCADIEAVPELLPQVWESTPLRIVSFLEMTCVKSRLSPDAVLRRAVDRIARLPSGKSFAGLSPHALYSTTPELMANAARVARERGWRVCAHVSESSEEFEMFRHGAGAMFKWIARNDRDMDDCGARSPVRQLAELEVLGPNLLAIHANYLDPDDPGLLADHGVSVVHCPRSHAYFEHRPFPHPSLAKAGVNLCLGTDSLATVETPSNGHPQLNLFEEMRVFLSSTPGVSPEEVVRMATVCGARALGLEGEVGELRPGTAADLIVLPYIGGSEGVHDYITHYEDIVEGSMIGGRWVIAPESCRLSDDTKAWLT